MARPLTDLERRFGIGYSISDPESIIPGLSGPNVTPFSMLNTSAAPDPVGLRARAKEHRDVDDQYAEQAAEEFDTEGYRPFNAPSSLLMTRMANNRARTMAMATPQWDSWFQAVREAAGDRDVNFRFPTQGIRQGLRRARGF